jgi:uncharacterized protein (TIGR02996 family)
MAEPFARPDGHVALDALVREVHARPDADDARLVLADALLARGDPRGELIALQLARGDDDRQRDRSEQLLRAHAGRWLGELRAAIYRARFARGFLTRLELNGRWTASEPGWARHLLDPQLATVEDLVPGRAVGPIYARFVTSPAMTTLRRIEVFDRPTLAALRETAANLVHVACPRWKVGKYVHELQDHVLPACARFAELRSFALHVDGIDSLIASSVVARLTAITVASGVARGLALWRRLPGTVCLTIARSAMLDDCATTRVAWTGALELTRVDGRVVGRGAGDWLLGELVDNIAALPAELDRLEIEGAGVHAGALTEAAKRRGFELVLRPIARRTGYVAGLDKRLTAEA